MASASASATASSSSASSKGGWRVPYIASRLYFALIIFQIPLFSVPCRSGICTTPIQVTSCQLTANEVFPPSVIKALLYPGALANSILTNMTLPHWNQVLDIYNITEVKNASALVDLQHLEVLIGSYFSVAGGLVGLINSGRMTLFGTLLLVWGLVKEGILGKPANADPTKAVYVHPTIVVAIICAFASIKYNLKKEKKNKQPVPIAKPLKSSAKSKLK